LNNTSQNKNLTSQTLSGVIWKFAERISAQLVTTIVSIILARILMPEDYGIVAIVNIVITICNVFVSYGFGTALIQKKDADDIDFSSVFYANIALSAVLYIIVFFTAPLIAQFYENDLLTPVLRVMGIRLPIAAINSVQQAYVSRKMQFRKFFIATLFGTIISGVVGIFMAYKGYGVWALVAQYLTNVCIDTIVLWFVVRWRPKLAMSWKKLKGLLSFGWKMLLSGLLNTGYQELRSLIIGKKYSSTDLAYYDQGKKYPAVIANNIDSSLTSVLLSSMSKVQDDKEKLKRATRNSIKLSSYLIMPCMVGFACLAEQFVEVVLTDKWLPAVPYIIIMCIVYMFYPIHTANLTAIQAAGRSDLFLILEIIKKVVGLASILISMWFGVFWIAMSSIITTIISSFINAFPNKKLLNYSYWEQIKDLLPNMIISAIMGCAVYFMGYIPINTIALLCLQVLTGIVIYIILSVITKNYGFYFIWGYIKNFFHKKKASKAVTTQEVEDVNVENESSEKSDDSKGDLEN
jgi:O-antigen/teichoic acid export membrane protein